MRRRYEAVCLVVITGVQVSFAGFLYMVWRIDGLYVGVIMVVVQVMVVNLRYRWCQRVNFGVMVVFNLGFAFVIFLCR